MDKLIHDVGQWSRLFEAVVAVKAMAPWEWMREDEIFAVRNPKTGELGFVSTMGMLGEHLAVSVYLGDKGLEGFWNLHQGAAAIDPDIFLQVPQLQLSFEDRNTLTNKDRQVIKDLGLKFRGRQAWPWLRSYHPGYYPWYLEPDEVEFLTLALEQLLEIAPRVRETPDLLMDEDYYLLREAQVNGDSLEWSDQQLEDEDSEQEMLTLMMDVDALERVQALDMVRAVLEMDLFLFPGGVGDRGERPQCVYMLLIIDRESGFVLDVKTLTPEPTLDSMYGKIPLIVVQTLEKAGGIPEEIAVKSFVLHGLLEELVPYLGFELSLSPVLPSLDEAQASLIGMWG